MKYINLCNHEVTFDGGRTSSSPSLASMSSPQELKSGRNKGEVRILGSRGQSRISNAHGKGLPATMRSLVSAKTLIKDFNVLHFIKSNN